jgi:hypothetical protein
MAKLVRTPAPEATRVTNAPRRRRAQRRPGNNVMSLRDPVTLGLGSIPSDVRRYIQSIFDDVLLTDVHLPNFGVVGQHARREFSTRFRPASGAVATSVTLINPYAVAFDNVKYEVRTAGAMFLNTIPGLMTAGFTSPGGWPVGTSTASTYTSVGMVNSYVNPGGSGEMVAKVRVQGVAFDIEYTGTELNKGAVLKIFHGASMIDYASQSLQNAGGNSWNTPSGINPEAAINNVALTRLGDRIQFVVRPTEPIFTKIKSYYRSEDYDTATSDVSYNVEIADILPIPSATQSNLSLGLSPFGWNYGFSLSGGNIGAGANTDFIVTIRVVADVSIHSTGAVIAGGQERQPNPDPTYSHAIAESHIRNALSTHHLANAQGMLERKVRSQPLLSRVERTAGRVGRRMLRGAESAIGDFAARALASV